MLPLLCAWWSQYQTHHVDDHYVDFDNVVSVVHFYPHVHFGCDLYYYPTSQLSTPSVTSSAISLTERSYLETHVHF